MVPTVQKVVSNVVPDMAVIEGHERSTGSQTLEKKSFEVIGGHERSEDISKWAMRDSNRGGQNPLYIEAALEQGTSRVAQGVARMQLSQVVALLIERWDELDSHSREEILWKLE